MSRFAAFASRRLRLAAFAFIAVLAVKLAAALAGATGGHAPPPASVEIRSAAVSPPGHSAQGGTAAQREAIEPAS